MKKVAAFFFLATFYFSFFGQSGVDLAMSHEEFRLGVSSYYRGSYNEAINQFEKALSYDPKNSLILDWLGKSYYRSGIEGAAIEKWQFAIQNDYETSLLSNTIDIMRERHIISGENPGGTRFVESGSFAGEENRQLYFSQPISALPLDDGTCWVSAYGSNEILHFDVNGSILERNRGPINGFDRPMDILQQKDGSMVVSEFAGDRLAHLDSRGNFLGYFGKKGLDQGCFLGPQYMAQDDSGNIFVTDFGNARISVFSPSGDFLFDFGKKDQVFGGFVAPSGIAVYSGVVYVADAVLGTIFSFDLSGNYIDVLLPNDTFVRPEAIKIWENFIIVSDMNKIFLVEIDSSMVFEIGNLGNDDIRITCAIPDTNGNLIATDFKSNEVYVLAKINELSYGLFVQIDRVNSENFPQVVLDIRVENKDRTPIVGLNKNNFFITEKQQPVLNSELIYSASESKVCDVSILLDRSEDAARYSKQMEVAVREIAASMGSTGKVQVVSAGEVPTVEIETNPANLLNFRMSQLKTPVSANVEVDSAIRLAASKLINGEKKRAVIFITPGTVGPLAFDKYGLANLSALMNNNGITFATVNLSNSAIAEELDYLSSQTGNLQYYVYRSEGLKDVINDIIARPNGVYQLRYTSSLPTNFGREFLSVELETYLLNRSGRAKIGYFAPLE